MSLKDFAKTEVQTPVDRRVEEYLEMYIDSYGNRFAKGYLVRGRDDSVDESKVDPFSDKLAIKFLANLAPEISGLASKENVYIAAGDVVVNKLNERVRHHLGRIAAVLHGLDPDDIRVKEIDWQNPDLYTPYQRGRGLSEAIEAQSIIFPDLKLPTGASCTYDFTRSPDNNFAAIEICGIAYSFNAEAVAA